MNKKNVISIQIVEISRNWSLQTEYDQLYDYITQAAIIRSSAIWYEMGERNNKYFLNLENSNKTKSIVPKVLIRNGVYTSDPNKIMKELQLYYSSLYDDRNCADMKTISSFINDLTDVPYLAGEKKNVCEGTLAWERWFNIRVLLSFLALVWKVGS